MSDVVGVIYGFPLAVIGSFWLVFATDIRVFSEDRVWMLIVFAAVVVFSKQRFYIMRELRAGLVLRSGGDFVGVVLWTAILIFGPAVIWLFILWAANEFCLAFRRTINANMRWDTVRSIVLNAASLTISTLVSSTVYLRLGGTYPLKGLDGGSLFPAMAAILIYAMMYFLIWLPFVGYIVWAQGRNSRKTFLYIGVTHS